MDVFLNVKPFFSHQSKRRTLRSDVEKEGGTFPVGPRAPGL